MRRSKAAGFLCLEQARVRWFLSIDCNDVPAEVKLKGHRTYRSLQIENEEIEFSDGFTNLHTRSYEEIIAGRGFTVLESKPSIEIVHNIRSVTPVGLTGDYHPYLKVLSNINKTV
jgi:UDP-N-acetyl-2-amino-2-deoxyglucuronate dehydrogenase